MNQIINKNDWKNIIISNKKMEISLDCSEGIFIEKLSLKRKEQDKVIYIYKGELFTLMLDGDFYASSKFLITKIEKCKDETQELISINLNHYDMGIIVRICLLNNMVDTINIILQLAIDWIDNYPKEVYLQMPFITDIGQGDEDKFTYFFPANPISKKDGTSVVQLHPEFPLPFGIISRESNEGFSIRFPMFHNNYFMHIQNRNLDLSRIKSKNEIKNHILRLRPGKVLTDIAELEIKAIYNGWCELFSRFKDQERKKIDMKQYKRDDFSWYRDSLLHHFTFVYGREVFDYESKKININRLLDQGDEFGGYDIIILWHQYPRLGIDQRSQWDFFYDFPGGVEGIKEIVEIAHRRGTRVFLPYKPWDISQDDSTISVAGKLADLVDKTNIDGFFLDTMNNVPAKYRKLIDDVKPGVLFCSEGHPGDIKSLEIETSSWDQYWNWESMPEVDLLRYVMPEHVSPIVARWHLGDKKDLLIKRAVFNGVGIVIWQDVFGSWLPYSEKQKSIIKKWKQVWCANKNAFTCSNPIPLYPTINKGLFCNMFPSDDGDTIVYTLYNDNDYAVRGDLIVHTNPRLNSIDECWLKTDVYLKLKNNLIISGSIPEKGVLVIKTYNEIK